MLSLFQNLYAKFFARTFFYKFNKLLYSLSLRGLGILNFESDLMSGEEKFITKYVSKISKGVILDIGANVGSYSIQVRELNPNIEIFAFEPHPKTFEILRNNVVGLDINVMNVGVGSENGVLKLYDYADKDGSEHASLYKDVIESFHKGTVVEHSVEVLSVDALCKENNIERIGLLKIDTEGHEMQVLKGASSYLLNNKIDLIHLEFNEMNVASRVFFKDFWDFLPNYDFYRMLPDGLVPIKNYSPVFCEIFAYQNIVAILKKN